MLERINARHRDETNPDLAIAIFEIWVKYASPEALRHGAAIFRGFGEPAMLDLAYDLELLADVRERRPAIEKHE
jgi:hypothetical protein